MGGNWGWGGSGRRKGVCRIAALGRISVGDLEQEGFVGPDEQRANHPTSLRIGPRDVPPWGCRVVSRWPRLAAGPDRRRRWHARSIGPSSSDANGWARCPHRRDRTWWPSRSRRSEEHTSELQSLMRISYAVFCLKKNTQQNTPSSQLQQHTT